MASQNLLTILHISDFHFTKRKQREQGIIVEALVADLKRLCIGHRKPDIVVFTGDLVQAAGQDSHDDAYDFIIDKVSKATGCSDERIFIIPGNHDLAWSALLKYESQYRSWRNILGSGNELDQLNALYEQSAFDDAIAEKFLNFFDLERYLGGDERRGTRRLKNSFASVDYIEALNLDLVSINTAVLSTGGHKSFAPDERQLAVPEYPMMEAIKALTPGSFRVFATHHPYAMLSEQSARYLEATISEHANIHLFGHMHDPQPKASTGLRGSVLSDQAGALFTQRRGSYNGYSLIIIDRDGGHAEINIRSYYDDRKEFDEGTDVIEGGQWWSSPEARQKFRQIAAPIDEGALRCHLKGPALAQLCQRESCLGDDASIHDRFVPPPLKRTFIQEITAVEGKVEIETTVKFNDVIEGSQNLIIYGKPEYGRTTLLKEIRYRSLIDAEAIRFPRLPILMDFRDFSPNTDAALRRAKGAAEAVPDGHDAETLLRLGHALILVDDVYFSNINRMKVLREFVARYPKARYILSSPQSSATQMGACIDPEMPVRFEFVEVREFRRNDMRQLLAKDERCTDVEEWLDRFQNEFREINLPFTAANGSILIEILSEKYNFTPINRSVLMEQFIDSTLRKGAIEQSRRETFDYTNKTDLLAHVAAWMAESENYIPSKEVLRSEIKAYIDARGLNTRIDPLLDEFLSTRILVERSGDRVSFRYRGVLEYFIALRMTSDRRFKDWVMEEDRYLKFGSEINYYAGKLRNDPDLINLISKRHLDLLTKSGVDVSDEYLSQLDRLELPNDDDDSEDLLDGFKALPLSKEEKDAELESNDSTGADEDQMVHRPKVEDAAERIWHSLLLYSGVVKNMELIVDTDKRRHLKNIWQSWGSMVVTSLKYAPKLARERRVRINGALYEVQAPHGMRDSSLLRKMMMLMPHVHIKMLATALGTEKLEKQLAEPTLDEAGAPKIIDLLKSGLVSELRLDSTPHAISATANALRSNTYLLSAFIVHVSELRRLDRVRNEHFKAIEEPLANAIANLRGGDHRAKENEKRRQLARLSRDRLLLELKRDKAGN